MAVGSRTRRLPRFEQFYAVRRFHLLGNVRFSPDGTEISYTHDGSGQFNLWRQPVTGGWATQLTTLDEDAVRNHAWTPHGLVMGIDHHGDEMWQLNRLGAAGGWPEDLTRNPEVRYQVTGVLSDDGTRLAVSGNQARPTGMSVYALHVADGELEPIVEDDGNWYPVVWHPDGATMLVGRMRSNTDIDLFLRDPQGALKPLTAHDGEEFNLGVGFTADGGGFLRQTDRGREFLWIGRQDIASGELTPIVQEDWDVEHAALSADRRRLAYSLNEDGRSTFHVLDLESGRRTDLSRLPSGYCLHFDFSSDGKRVAGVIGTGTRPADVYVAEVESGAVTRLTESFLGGVPETDLVEPELVRIPTFDGRQVPAWLYRPSQSSGKTPVLLSIHGGPEAQERPGSSAGFAFYQYLLSRGVAILAPNVRGSTGYGITYQKLIHRDWGGDELKDIEACAKYLRGLDWVEGDRMAVYGGSFGGFATLSAMTRLPEYWACGVDLVGPSNLVTFAKAVPPHWREMMKAWVGDPDTEASFLMSRSPISYVDQIRAPLMVLQGAKDPRVVKPESDQMVARLRELGREVEYHVFDDEGHGFAKHSNQLKAYRLIAEFLFKHLKVES